MKKKSEKLNASISYKFQNTHLRSLFVLYLILAMLYVQGPSIYYTDLEHRDLLMVNFFIVWLTKGRDGAHQTATRSEQDVIELSPQIGGD